MIIPIVDTGRKLTREGTFRTEFDTPEQHWVICALVIGDGAERSLAGIDWQNPQETATGESYRVLAVARQVDKANGWLQRYWIGWLQRIWDDEWNMCDSASCWRGATFVPILAVEATKEIASDEVHQAIAGLFDEYRNPQTIARMLKVLTWLKRSEGMVQEMLREFRQYMVHVYWDASPDGIEPERLSCGRGTEMQLLFHKLIGCIEDYCTTPIKPNDQLAQLMAGERDDQQAADRSTRAYPYPEYYTLYQENHDPERHTYQGMLMLRVPDGIDRMVWIGPPRDTWEEAARDAKEQLSGR